MSWNRHIGYIVVGAIGVAVSAAIVIANADVARLLAPAILLLLYLALRFPEVSFVLFLYAGIYKADPRLEVLQRSFDLTLFWKFSALWVF